MMSKKNWTIFLVLFFVTILTIILLSNTKKPLSPSYDSAKQILENNESSKFNHIKDVKTESEVINITTKVALPPSVPFDVANKIEIIQRIMELSKQRQSDPTTVLQIKDFSQEEQVLQKEWLASYQEKGFIEVSETTLEAEKLRNELVEFADLSSSSISVVLQDVNNTKLSQYEYMGAILDKDENNNNIAAGVKRLYRDSEGQKIFLYERSVENTQAILVDEFVTDTIQGYPATRMTYCTEGQRCVSEITLITTDKQYKISMDGNREVTKEKLIEIISSFELPVLEERE